MVYSKKDVIQGHMSYGWCFQQPRFVGWDEVSMEMQLDLPLDGDSGQCGNLLAEPESDHTYSSFR